MRNFAWIGFPERGICHSLTSRSLLFLALLLALLFSRFPVIAIANHVQSHKVRRAGLGARTSDDADDLIALHVPVALQNLLGDSEEFGGVARVGTKDRIGSPQQHVAIHNFLVRRQCEDWRLRAVL